MSQYIDNQEVLNNVAEWIQVAIDNSSMGLKPNAPRGLGIRRLYEGKSTKVEYHILDNQLRNGLDQGVYLSNPFYQIPICRSGVGKPGLNGPESLTRTKVEEICGTKYNADELMPKRFSFPQASGMITDESGAKCPLFQPSVGVKANEAALEKAKKNFRKEYVAWGSQRFSRASQKGHQGSFYGNCDAFTCTIISGLIESRTFISIDGAKVTNPTPEGVMVECYYADVGKDTTKAGHTFTVVNRRPDSDMRDPSGWGDACFVIDHWYALQVVMPLQPLVSVFMVRDIRKEGSPAEAYFGTITQSNGRLLNGDAKMDFEVQQWTGDIFAPGYRDLTKEKA